MKPKLNILPATDQRPGYRINWKNVIVLLLGLGLAFWTERLVRNGTLTHNSRIGAVALLFIGVIAISAYVTWKRHPGKSTYAFVFFVLGAVFAVGVTMFLMEASNDVVRQTLLGAFVMLVGLALFVINGVTTWWPNEREVRNLRDDVPSAAPVDSDSPDESNIGLQIVGYPSTAQAASGD